MNKILAAIALLVLTAPVTGKDLDGQLAPDFALRSSLGQNLRLSEYRGQVVMINFWATWCGPCRQEMPALDAIYDRYNDVGFTLLGVNIDENPQQAMRMAERLKVTFPVLFDERKEVSKMYDVRAMPVTVLIDRDGRVRSVHQGYQSGREQEYLNEVRALLRET